MQFVRLGATGLLLLLVAAFQLGAAAEPRVLGDLSYVDEPVDKVEQSLDLFLPAATDAPPPLVVFVHSRFWSSATGGRVIVDGFARPLQRLGVAVAIVRHRLAPAHRHPAAAQDVAAAVRFLVEGAERYGYDPARIFLTGHSSGAHLASLVGLDPRYLKAEGLGTDALAGVVGMSGVYDLDPEGELSQEEARWYEQAFGDVSVRREASPRRRLRPDAPRMLLLAAQEDIPGYVRGADGLASALRDAGHPDAESYVVMGRNHASILDLERDHAGTPMYLLDFIGVQPLPPSVAELRAAAQFWRKPPFSTEPFWTSGVPVRSHPADERFQAFARRIYQGLRHKRLVFRAETFHAIDLLELLDALGPDRVGSGDWLVTTNVQGEKTYLRLSLVQPYQPVLVIGIDGERNLFRKVDVHKARREYSWRDDLPSPPYSARSMGAFLYFLEEPPTPAMAPVLANFSLEISGFARSEEDPLAKLRDLDVEVQRVLTVGNGCVQCHSLRGIGPRSGHLRATDAELQGGFALPLEEYPEEVWKRFIFEPDAAAEMIGASLNPVRGPVASKLFELVERERAANASVFSGPRAR